MSQPIFHKRQISASVEQVCGNRVLQAMELPFLYWQACDRSIRLHEMVEHVPANRYVSIREKEIRRLIGTYTLTLDVQ
jgi:hypothetical protein